MNFVDTNCLGHNHVYHYYVHYALYHNQMVYNRLHFKKINKSLFFRSSNCLTVLMYYWNFIAVEVIYDYINFIGLSWLCLWSWMHWWNVWYKLINSTSYSRDLVSFVNNLWWKDYSFTCFDSWFIPRFTKMWKENIRFSLS